MRTVLAVAVGLVLTTFAALAQDKPHLERAPPFSVGDQWTFQALDMRRGRVTISILKNDARIQFPLDVGKSYSTKEYYTIAQGETGDRDLKVTEKVQTMAGEFDAYRIYTTGGWYNRSNRSAGTVEGTLWFAPSANRIVKYQQKSFWQGQATEYVAGELVEFRVGP